MKNNKFLTKFRLKTNGQFKIVFTKGNKISSNLFAIFYYKNGLSYPRIGIITTKKNLPNAVMRNKFKRIARESFRLSVKNKHNGIDIIVFAYKGKVNSNLDSGSLRKCLDQYLKKII